MDQPSVLLTRLNFETQVFHALADEGWRALQTPTVTTAAYVDELVRVYGFEGPLEAALAYTPNLEVALHLHQRFRAGFIAQDLITLGMRAGEVARLPQQLIAPFASPLEALGWIYVVERSTPSHEDVRRCISTRLPQAARATAYLEAHGGHVGARWRSLGQALDRAARTPQMADEIVAGAHAAFRTWIGWRSRGGSQRRLG